MNVVLIAAVSADGKIASSPGQSSLEWTSKEDTKFFISKTKEIGTVVMGRKTFETIGKPLKDRRVIVMTHKPAITYSPPFEGGVRGGYLGIVEFTAEAPRDLLARLEKEGVKAVALAGGAQVYSAFLRDGLVDELYLTVEPYLFGAGIPLVDQEIMTKLELVAADRLGPGILLHFRVLK